MNAFRFSPARFAVLFFLLSAAGVTAPLGCSSSTSHPDAGSGGSTGASGGATGSGSGGSAAGSGGSNGRIDAGLDARADLGGGAGGMIVIVDAAGNHYTCADLLACCNSTANAALKAACLQQYTTASMQGDPGCNNVLTQIKANQLCL